MEWISLVATLFPASYFGVVCYRLSKDILSHIWQSQTAATHDIQMLLLSPTEYILRSFDEAGVKTRALYLLRDSGRFLIHNKRIRRITGREESFYYHIPTSATKRPLLLATSIKVDGEDKALD